VDGNKKVKGRKRHLSVDVLGLALDCYVTAANVADIKAAPAIWVELLEQHERVSKILADQSYLCGAVTKLLQSAYDCQLEISPRLGVGFVVEPLRWVVERTFAWLDNARVLCRDYEALPENHEGMIYVVMIQLMLRRLGNNRRTRKSKNA
jgi:putative transposase